MARSAGLVLYRVRQGVTEVLLGHMGGPLWARRTEGAWTIPKGEVNQGESEHAAALREFTEELGAPPPVSNVPDVELGSVRQRSGKVVVCWARQGDFDISKAESNLFDLEGPPHSGVVRQFPELDRAAWFTLAAAREMIVVGQRPLLDRLEQARHPRANSTLPSDAAARPQPRDS